MFKIAKKPLYVSCKSASYLQIPTAQHMYQIFRLVQKKMSVKSMTNFFDLNGLKETLATYP